MKKIIALTLGLSASLYTQAHMLWLERDIDTQTKAYFGEYSEQLKDTQESSLKSFNAAVAIQDKQKLKASIQHDHLLYTTQGNTDVQLSNDMMYGESLLRYHAKAGRMNTKAESELDIVPVQANSSTFQVFYQGKPAANVKVVVFSPEYWQKNYSSDTQGMVKIETPWKGQYVIEVSKESDHSGTFQQKPYKKQYLVTTLSFNHS